MSMYFELAALLFRELSDDQHLSVVGCRLEVNVAGAKEVVTQLMIRYE